MSQKLIVMPGFLPHGENGNEVPLHIKIQLADGKLSISGVVGAKSNGDCWGSAGQCIDSLIDDGFRPAKNWTKKMALKLHGIWEKWHLNDMYAECEHQVKLGWREQAKEKVKLYHWRLSDEAASRKTHAKEAALNSLKIGIAFTPTSSQTYYSVMPDFITTHTEEQPKNYVKHESSYIGGQRHVEVKALGWLRPDEHPDGLLCRPCPVCGYKRGTSWKHHDIPADVTAWLYELPKASKKCAWAL